MSCKGCSAVVGAVVEFPSPFGDSDEFSCGCSSGAGVTGDGLTLPGAEYRLLRFVLSVGDSGTASSSVSCSVATEDEIDVVDDP